MDAQSGVFLNLARGALHVFSSTISLELTRQLAQKHAEASQRFVAASVFGDRQPAATRQLFVLAGGDSDAVEAAMPLSQAISIATLPTTLFRPFRKVK